MSVFEAFILGVVQGATEFLPVSSSGHSILIPAIFELNAPDLNAVVVAHLGTIVAVLIYFHRDLWAIATAVLVGLRKRSLVDTPDARLGWYLVAGTIPAGIAGLLLDDLFENMFGSPQWAAFFLLGTAGLLVAGERMLSGRKLLADMDWADALIIGLFQMVALLPGISRSGSTIVGGLSRGLSRELAARYSFLLSVPVILGAGALQLFELLASGNFAEQLPVLVTIFLTSGIVGYACIAFLMAWVRQRSLYPFAVYCGTFGLVYLLVSFIR